MQIRCRRPFVKKKKKKNNLIVNIKGKEYRNQNVEKECLRRGLVFYKKLIKKEMCILYKKCKI